MSTDQQRAKNRAKQKRWRVRHAAELRQKADMRLPGAHQGGRRPSYEVVELLDPRDALPRCVLVVKIGEPWPVAVAAWIDELAGLGMVPVRSTRWVPNGVWSKRMCERLRRLRVRQIHAWNGGKRPDWLLA